VIQRENSISLFLTVLLLTVASNLWSQLLPPCSPTNVDGLLAGREFKEASRYLDAHPLDANTNEEYRSIITRLEAAANIPDSVTLPISNGGLGLQEKFNPADAGMLATGCYKDFRAHFDKKNYARAYERYVLADFLRIQFVRCERARLRGNLDRTQKALDGGNLSDAQTLIQQFKQEPTSSPFSTFGDTLTKAYGSLEVRLHEAMRTHKYESERKEFSPTLLIAAGGNLLPGYSLGFNEVVFHTGNPANAGAVDGDGNAVSLSPVGFSVDLSYFFSPSVAVGVTYQRSGGKYDGSVGARPVLRYQAEIRNESGDLWFKYLFDSREGRRPFITVGGGFGKTTLFPEDVSGDPSRIYVVRMEESGAHFAGELGLEFVPSISFPLSLQGFVHGLVNADTKVVLKPAQVYFGVKLGWFL
jgi:hypothetical protein